MQIKAAIQASLQDMDNHLDSKADDKKVNCASEKKDDWKNYLGDDENKVEIVIRYPDGNRENIILPSTSKMKVVFAEPTLHLI